MLEFGPADVSAVAQRLALATAEARFLAPGHPFLRIGAWHGFASAPEPADGAALPDGELVRLVASVDPRQRNADGPLGCLGFMHIGTDPAASLVTAGVEWLRARGVTTVRCPVQLSTWYGHRAMTGGFPEGPDGIPVFPFEPRPDPGIVAAAEAAGFRPASRAVSCHVDSRAVATDTAAAIDRARRAGIRDRPIRLADLDAELRLLHRLAAEIFEGTWGLSDITFDEFATIYRPLEGVVNPALVRFLEIDDGQPIGFALGLPAAPAATTRGPSGVPRGPSGDVFVLKSIGVTSAARRRVPGIGAALVGMVHRAALERGCHAGIHALMAEGSNAHRLSLRWGDVFRSYATFERRLE